MHDELSSRIPIIRIWHSLLVSLQGDITDEQAAGLTDDVLHEIRKGGFSALVLDLSGLWLVDSHLCAVIAHLAKSAELMGTQTIISGIRPDVTVTLLSMDVALNDVRATLSLEQALEALGVRGPQHRADPSKKSMELATAMLKRNPIDSTR